MMVKPMMSDDEVRQLLLQDARNERRDMIKAQGWCIVACIILGLVAWMVI